jgi:hypothetical protein
MRWESSVDASFAVLLGNPSLEASCGTARRYSSDHEGYLAEGFTRNAEAPVATTGGGEGLPGTGGARVAEDRSLRTLHVALCC